MAEALNGAELRGEEDVLLGGMYAEYENPADKGDEAVRLSRLRMPLPARITTAAGRSAITSWRMLSNSASE